MSKILQFVARFSLLTKAMVVLLSLSIALIYSVSLNMSKNRDNLNKLNISKIGNQINLRLLSLMQHLSHYTLLWINAAASESITTREMTQYQNQIESDLFSLEQSGLMETLQKKGVVALFTTHPSLELAGIRNRWEELNLLVWNLEKEERLEKLFKINESVSNLIIYIGAFSNQQDTPDISWFALSDTIQHKLPEMEKLVPHILAEYRFPTGEDKARLITLISRLYNNMDSTRSMVERAYYQVDEDKKGKLYDAFENYIDQLLTFVTMNEKLIPSETIQPSTFSKLMASSLKILNNNRTLANLIHQEINQRLEDKIETLKWNQLVELIFECSTIIFAFLMFFLTFLQLRIPIQKMIATIQQFRRGDVSARIPIVYEDEIGYLATILNDIGRAFQEIFDQLRSTSGQMTESTAFIADASKQEERITREQEESTFKITRAVNAIADTVKKSADQLGQITHQSTSSTEIAHLGKKSLKQMEQEMRDMVEAAKSISTKLNILHNRAGSITGIIVTISKIAEETHRLSLNVAIQAEKIVGTGTGDHRGSGLLVIAREIRRLADETSKAVFTIEEVVNEMMSAVNTSVIGVDKFSEKIHNGVENMSQLKEHLTDIIQHSEKQNGTYNTFSEGMLSQLQGTSAINQAIDNWRKVNEERMFSVSQLQRGTTQLNKMAKELEETICKIGMDN